jgi:beta-N-acetylhexosaminidase
MNINLDQLGLHFIVGLSSTSLSEDERELLEQLRPAGIILFAHNFAHESSSWIEQLHQLLEDTKKACKRKHLLISIDHEGGRVHRFKPPIAVTRFPPAALCYKDGGLKECREVAQGMARELHALGINFSYCPVLDVLSNPLNKVIGDRAFSTDPKEVAEAGIVQFQRLENNGILACGKHFPGHGATAEDSHEMLPIINATYEELSARDIYPFKMAINAGLKMIMTSHVLYKSLDTELPATLSKKIISDLLRNELKFDGVVISDALDMRALEGISAEEIGEKVLLAGGDMFCVAQPKTKFPVEHAIRMAKHLQTNIQTNQLDFQTVAQSQIRIAELLDYSFGIYNSCSFGTDVIGTKSP